MRKLILIWMIIFSGFAAGARSGAILITAATGSFGEALSFHFASEKFDLILAGRDKNKLDDLKKRILTVYKNSNISTLIADFSDIEAMQASIQNIKLSQLDGVVLIGPRPELTRNTIPNPEEWKKAFSETFVAPLELLKKVIPSIRDNGSIVIISGSTSKDYSKSYPNTNVMRLAWIGEVKNLMHFLATRKIRVNAVSPGPILTKFHREKITKTASDNKVTFEEQIQKNAKSIPLGTYGSLDDISHLVGFLMSEKSKHLNGTNILLDGGESNAY